MTGSIKVGEKKFTLEEYQKRWRGHPQEIWTFLVDFGTIEEMHYGEKLVEFFPKVVEKAFNKIYEEIEKCDVTQNIIFPMTHKGEIRYRLGCFQFGKFDMDKFESRCKKSGSAPPGKLDLENRFSIERDYFQSYVLNHSRIDQLREWFPPEFPAVEKFWNEYFSAIGGKLKENFWDTFADEQEIHTAHRGILLSTK